LADAFRFTYFELSEERGADETIREALRCPGPVFVNAIVDETQNFVPKLSSKVLPDGRIVSPSMDDMFPFLPREEYEANRFNPQK
ncbi:MAG: thiamine pyrophosphate-binding protein, partial [Lachnospiraceae bacterium]|nr:thiamine pyrophosphate-binding protein [Lachnospiraceae bacterium]